MPIVVEPQSGIPFPFDTTPEEIEQFRERAKAAVETIKEIIALGGEVEVTQESKDTARKAVSENTTLKISEKNAGALVHLEAILSEYDKDLINAASRLRSYVTNKLLIETIDEDARIRLKALELLGKTSSVGLFSDRLEVNVTHRTVEQVDAELEGMLEKYLGPVDEVPDEELDKFVAEKQSLLAMSDEELGFSDAQPKKPERIEESNTLEDFKKALNDGT
jgi:hypothetical protein